MKFSFNQLLLVTGSLSLLLSGCIHLSNQDRGKDEKRAEPLPGAPAPNFEKYRTPLVAHVVDRRFRTKEAMYLANEMSFGGFPFFEEAVGNELVSSDADFQYMTTVESYWYSRYNMSCLVTESRMGVHSVFSPYVTEWALREGRANNNRDRGEYVRSNKGALLQEIVPLYQARTGFPRRFEDASPTMLQFASGDPHFIRPVDKGVMFESTENLERDKELRKIYGDTLPARSIGLGIAGNDMWKARINYRENFLTLRWDESKMEHVCDLGAEGQTLMKQVLWMEYFFRQSHHGGQYLGNANLWDEQMGLYRSHLGATVTEYTPLNLGAALGAMREIILITKAAPELERYKRFWVQGIDSSGIQQSEYEETGEKDFYAKDGDGDGIPRMEYADGRHGIAPVFASRVEIQTPTRLSQR